MALERLSGAFRMDGVHPGHFTLLLATDLIRGLPTAFARVDANDHDRERIRRVRIGGPSGGRSRRDPMAPGLPRGRRSRPG